jgi:hypothetical protein
MHFLFKNIGDFALSRTVPAYAMWVCDISLELFDNIITTRILIINVQIFNEKINNEDLIENQFNIHYDIKL